MTGLTPQQERYLFQDRRAYLFSFFSKHPVPRKFDCWYYEKGKKISGFDLLLKQRKYE